MLFTEQTLFNRHNKDYKRINIEQMVKISCLFSRNFNVSAHHSGYVAMFTNDMKPGVGILFNFYIVPAIWLDYLNANKQQFSIT